MSITIIQVDDIDFDEWVVTDEDLDDALATAIEEGWSMEDMEDDDDE